MKTRSNDLWLIAILTILLIVVIIFFPSNIARIILGLPLILFFPGYTLIAALFPRRESLGGVERVALSFGLSIAVVPLIGLILNYTPWGIRLYPILISLSSFILIMSGVAWHRRRGLVPEERFSVEIHPHLASPFKGEGVVDKALSVVLVLAIIGVIGTLGYVVATPKVGEKFTEFYILGLEGKAEDYPETLKVGEEGKVILGIVNHEHEQVSYRIGVRIDGEKAKLRIGDEGRDMIEVDLSHEEKWEGEVGFVPREIGKKQKVEFVLYKEGKPYFKAPPHLWVDVEEGRP